MPAPAAPTILGREPASLSGVASVQIPINMGPTLWKWYPEKYKFLSMLQKLNRLPMPITEGRHLEKRRMPNFIQYIGADETAGSEEATAFASGEISKWDRLNIWDMLFNPRTEESMIVDSTVAAALPICRGSSIGSITAPLKHGDVLLRYSSQKEEGGEARDAMSVLKEAKYWYAGTWRHSCEVTLDTEATEMYVNKSQRLEDRADAAQQHKQEMAQHIFLNGNGGDYSANTSTTYGHKMCNGMMGLINTHIWNCRGSLRWDDLKAFLRGPLKYAQGPLMIMTSAKIIDIITSYGNDYVQITPAQKYWGWEYEGVKIGGKTLPLVHEEMFDEDPHLEGMAFIASPKHCAWHPVSGNSKNLDTMLHKNIRTHNNPELVKDEFVTHGGVEFFIEPAFGRIYGA